MCAQFMLKADHQTILALTGLKNFDLSRLPKVPERVLPKGNALVVVKQNGEKRLEAMRFGLLPRWSKELVVKFSTHNARLDSLDKPTWRDAFKKRHAVVAMTDFIEPIYEGQWAGHMVRFHQENNQPMLAAAIWENWQGQDGQIIDSFSILTDDPIPFVEKTGHDRSPVFIDQEAVDLWLDEKPLQSSDEGIRFLRKNKAALHLVVESDRPMKPGWEKRKG